MIPKKPAPDLIRGGNRFSEKHALGLDPRDHAQTEKLERDDESKKIHPAFVRQTIASRPRARD
jgi:hypothetical protein